MKSSSKMLSVVVLGLAVLAAAGCATSRGVMEVETAESVNPDSGTAVRFAAISDKRTFEVNPDDPQIPSLKGNEINDAAITSRAIARKRNTFGKAMGDILLPEGQTVMAIVAASLAKGLRENGYRVLDESDAGYDDAAPLDVSIDRFWGWFQPGFWQVKLHFGTELTVTGPVEPFAQGKRFSSDVEMGYQAATESNWRKTMDGSLVQLNQDMSSALR